MFSIFSKNSGTLIISYSIQSFAPLEHPSLYKNVVFVCTSLPKENKKERKTERKAALGRSQITNKESLHLNGGLFIQISITV